MMRIAYLPLDERPVNTTLVRDIAELGGAELLLPPAQLLPDQRRPGAAEEIGQWLAQVVDQGRADTVLAALDMLAYGGLIASRTSADDVRVVLERLAVLSDLKQTAPQVPIYAVSLVMRASDSYSGGEEPQYWSQYGRELHAYGGAQHRAFLEHIAPGGTAEPADIAKAAGTAAPNRAVPGDVLLDFTHRRLRNHIVNLTALDLAAHGTVDTLMITSDDTAVHSAGSLEQLWLQNWSRILPGAQHTAFYPGADEVGAVLLARALSAGAGAQVLLAPVCPEPHGWSRVAPFENLPLDQATERQIRAAAAQVSEPGAADVVLILHAPAPTGLDRDEEQDATSGDTPVQRTVDAVADHLRAGHRVAVADVRHPNGSDPALVTQLERAGLLQELMAYGGWNTAGNTIGAVVATAVAGVLSARTGQVDQLTTERLRLHRILEDHEYQGVLRGQLSERLQRESAPLGLGERFASAHVETEVVEAVTARLQAAADRLTRPGRWQVTGVHMPWHRLFEVGFTLVPGPAHTESNGTVTGA